MTNRMKRSATSDLNRDNWDVDDEPEEAGTFRAVGQEELSKRVIRQAKRRLPRTSSDDQRPLFTNFTGFGVNKPTTTDPKSSFSFLANLNGSSGSTSNPLTSASASNNGSKNTSESDSSKNIFKDSSKNTSTVNNGNTSDKDKSVNPSSNNAEDPKTSKEKEYLENIKALNECLIEWLNTCIQKNPSGILTPIFRDYEKHLETLNKSLEDSKNVSMTANVPVAEKKEEPKKDEAPKPNEPALNFKFNTVSSSSPGLSKAPESGTLSAETSISKTSSPLPTTPSFGLNLPATNTSSPIPATTSSWLSSSAVSKSNVFTNLAASTNVKPSPLFGNLSSNPFPIPSNSGNKETAKEESKDEDEDQPPVNDFKPVTEDDALFSQRVKLFVQKDKQYSDRGVGTLYIKEAKDGKGNIVHQATIRADTSLGNIIFNMRITKDIPTKRLGKNNVMLVCPSNSLPEAQGPSDSKADDKEKKPHPVTVLFRVKTSEEADKLLEEIDKYK